MDNTKTWINKKEWQFHRAWRNWKEFIHIATRGYGFHSKDQEHECFEMFKDKHSEDYEVLKDSIYEKE